MAKMTKVSLREVNTERTRLKVSGSGKWKQRSRIGECCIICIWSVNRDISAIEVSKIIDDVKGV